MQQAQGLAGGGAGGAGQGQAAQRQFKWGAAQRGPTHSRHVLEAVGPVALGHRHDTARGWQLKEACGAPAGAGRGMEGWVGGGGEGEEGRLVPPANTGSGGAAVAGQDRRPHVLQD